VRQSGRSAERIPAGFTSNDGDPGADEDVVVLNMAVILPDALKPQKKNWPFSIQKVAPALELALERIVGGRVESTVERNAGGSSREKTKSVQYRISYADSGCHSAMAINEAFVFYQRGRLDVILGTLLRLRRRTCRTPGTRPIHVLAAEVGRESVQSRNYALSKVHSSSAWLKIHLALANSIRNLRNFSDQMNWTLNKHTNIII
jgi:hypothetical protein